MGTKLDEQQRSRENQRIKRRKRIREMFHSHTIVMKGRRTTEKTHIEKEEVATSEKSSSFPHRPKESFTGYLE